ncbi:MAG: hypothetical protein ACYSU1_05275 [Planctomycetota bacterium]|jgi:hypothetical protein
MDRASMGVGDIAEAKDLIRNYRRLLHAFTGGDAGLQDSKP